ncbi:DivIVA domain-containing protein [Enterococcus alishanensis]
MDLDSEKVKRVTFPSASVGGYKKQDVDDFLKLIARDYHNFEKKVDELQEQWQQATEKADRLREIYMNREQQYLDELKNSQKELKILKEERRSSMTTPKPTPQETSFQKAIMIAQDTAFEIEKAAEKEKEQILEKAAFDRGRMIKKARTESAEILEKAKQQEQRILQEANIVKQNAENHARSVEKHYQETLQELSMKKQKQEEQAKSELSKLSYEKRQLEQDLVASRQEEMTFLESQIYEHQMSLSRLDKQKWQQLAKELTDRLEKI